MNDAIVISQEGATRMLLHNQWIAREAPKRGLRDPWAYRPDRPIDEEEVISLINGKKLKGTKLIFREATDKEMEAWRVERDNYMTERDEWIALQMFKKYGYKTFLEDCRMYNLSEEFQKSVLPCESHGDAQCSMFCPTWDTCAFKKFE